MVESKTLPRRPSPLPGGEVKRHSLNVIGNALVANQRYWIGRQAPLRHVTSIPFSLLLPRPFLRRALPRGCSPWRSCPRDTHIRRSARRSLPSEPLPSTVSSTWSDRRP